MEENATRKKGKKGGRISDGVHTIELSRGKKPTFQREERR
jgi:hypothetical protein